MQSAGCALLMRQALRCNQRRRTSEAPSAIGASSSRFWTRTLTWQSEAIRGHQRRSEAIQGNPRQAKASRGKPRPSEAIRGSPR